MYDYETRKPIMNIVDKKAGTQLVHKSGLNSMKIFTEFFTKKNYVVFRNELEYINCFTFACGAPGETPRRLTQDHAVDDAKHKSNVIGNLRLALYNALIMTCNGNVYRRAPLAVNSICTLNRWTHRPVLRSFPWVLIIGGNRRGAGEPKNINILLNS